VVLVVVQENLVVGAQNRAVVALLVKVTQVGVVLATEVAVVERGL